MTTPPNWPHDPHTDIAEFNRIYPDVQKLEALANKHGIYDIFQDNNGKLLQVVLLLNLKIVKGRTGNDAVDPAGTEYELKTVNLNNSSPAFTTHHHLNQDILDKYRTVPWIFTTFQGINIERIYLFGVDELDLYFDRWQSQITAGNGDSMTKRFHLNNPKISLGHVKRHGTVIMDNTSSSTTAPLLTVPNAAAAQAALQQAVAQSED